MMKNLEKILMLTFSIIGSIILSSCGDNELVSSEADYKPKIVIEGLIYPGEDISGIRISRNFPLNQNVDASKLYLMDAQVILTDLETNNSYNLEPNNGTFSFEYNGAGLSVGYGKSYKLDITAVIDGKTLHTSSITKTPSEGFRIIPERSIAGTLKYREKDANGEVKQFGICFEPTVGASFYAFSISSSAPTIESFIFDNDYFEIDTSDVTDDFLSFSQRYNWTMNLNSSEAYTHEISWLDLWFYGTYRIVVYAGDKNYHHFMATYGDVQEMDGNFHEPKFYIDGDGIGYFGSAIADTIYVNVAR